MFKYEIFQNNSLKIIAAMEYFFHIPWQAQMPLRKQQRLVVRIVNQLLSSCFRSNHFLKSSTRATVTDEAGRVSIDAFRLGEILVVSSCGVFRAE
jgi:hypothetical protein